MTTLDTRVQALPAELFNNILEMALTTDEDVVEIDKNYKPPMQLSLSRATRAFAERQYYGKTCFSIAEHKHRKYEEEVLYLWLPSLTSHAQSMISSIRIYRRQFSSGTSSGRLSAAKTSAREARTAIESEASQMDYKKVLQFDFGDVKGGSKEDILSYKALVEVARKKGMDL